MKINTKKILAIIILFTLGIGIGMTIFEKPQLSQATSGNDLVEINSVNPDTNVVTKTAIEKSLYKASKRLKIGTAIKSKNLESESYKAVLNQNFNLVVPEYEMKWYQIQPEINKYNFSVMDKIVEYAKLNDKEIYGHTLLWYRSIPSWVEPYLNSLPEAQRGQALKTILKDFITTIVNRYKDVVKSWDVVNEVLEDFSRAKTPPSIYRTDNIFDKYIGSKDEYNIPEYIKLGFQYAREADSKAKLFYNDYQVEYYNSVEASYGGSIKSENMYNMVSGLIKMGVPIDGVGIQSHVTNSEKLDKQAFTKNNIQNYPLYKTMDAYNKLGLEVKITEMDVAVYQENSTTVNPEKLLEQANTYQNYLLVCILFDNCTSFTVWQFSDNFVWYGKNFPGKKEDYHPNIFDRKYNPKPAYFALLKTLSEN